MSLGIATRMLQLPRLPTFNYQAEVHKKLGGIDTMFATYNVSLLCCHERKEMMSICKNERLKLKMLVK